MSITVDAVAFPLVANTGRMVSTFVAIAPAVVTGMALLGVLVVFRIPRSIADVTVNPLLRCVVRNAAVLVVIIRRETTNYTLC